MGNGHHAVLATCKEVIGLALPPVLVNQIVGVGPLKVLFHCAIVQTDPGVVVTETVDELLLGSRDDTTEVGAVLSAVFLCILPGVSVGEVPVAVAVELPPAVLTTFNIFLTHVSSVAGQAKAEEGINLVDASASICTRLGLAVVNVNLTVLPSVSLWAVAGVARSLRKALPSVQTWVCHAGLHLRCWTERCGADVDSSSSSCAAAFFLHGDG